GVLSDARVRRRRAQARGDRAAHRELAPRYPLRDRSELTMGPVMRVSVFGRGYVGTVSAAALAADGHEVIGVDVHPGKVAAVNAGRSPVVEPGLDALLDSAVAERRLRATTDTAAAVRDSEVSLLCVGTPSRRNGSLDLTYLERVSEQIGRELRSKSSYHVIVVRSTVLPGTTHEVVI